MGASSDMDMTQLHTKIDELTAQVQAQQTQIELLLPNNNGYQRLDDKLDSIISYVDDQRRRQAEMDEFKNDVLPIANHMVKLSIDELAEIGSDFQLEDMFFLVKRLLRDVNLLTDLLGRMESTVELFDEVQVIGNQAFHQAVLELDRMEREGYFNFARSGYKIIQRIVEEFDEEDVNALGDNIVTILTTVKNLTQPEIMDLTNNALSAFNEEPVPDGNVSVLQLLREMSDPKVRRGMARLMNMVKVLADQPAAPNN
jgi:uncharacterized protein YjgD (DUF1641 family)